MSLGTLLLIVIIQILRIYVWAVIAAALISWVFLPPTNPIVRFLRFITEPVLNPCRQLLYRVLPFRWRRIDLSPVLAILLIQLLIMILSYVAAATA